MQVVYKCLNSVQTELITWGDPFNCNGKDVILCITGNPGVPDFYIEFGCELHRSTGLPICVVGQAGHINIPGTVLEKDSYYNLDGQLQHKLDLLLNHIDKQSNLHLIGHSIGAWMLVELLNKNDVLFHRVLSVNLLFPTLQRMLLTKNGQFLNGTIRKIHLILIFLLKLIYLLPKVFRFFLIAIYTKFNSMPAHYSERILKFLNPEVVQKVLLLAFDEMDRVTDLNVEGMHKIKHLTNVIYSNRDGWAPLQYMDDLKVFQPPLQMKEVDINHAFVLKSSERVAELVSSRILHSYNT